MEYSVGDISSLIAALSIGWWIISWRAVILFHLRDGYPHGYGVWSDDSYHGECLLGRWRHGVPVGPFTSRERGEISSGDRLLSLLLVLTLSDTSV